jgi:hypothetical protein
MKPIPIYLKRDPNMPRPEDPQFYWVTGGGIYFCRNHPLFASDVPAKYPPRSLAAHQPWCQVKYPKLRRTMLEYIVGFFDRVYTQYGSESIVLVYWDHKRHRYRLRIPKQQATVWESTSGYRSAMNVTYQVPLDTPPHQLLVGDIHCHCDFGAGPSTTDEQDEQYRDGVHAIVGHIDREPPEFTIMISVDGFRFSMRFDQLFRGYLRRRRIVPPEWLAQLSVKINRPQAPWSNRSYAYDERWSGQTSKHHYDWEDNGGKA